MQNHLIEETPAKSELPSIGHNLIARLADTADLLAEKKEQAKPASTRGFMSRWMN